MRGRVLSNMLHDGLYEQIINKGLETELSVTDKLSTTAPIDSAEASKVLAKYIAEVVEKGLDNVADNGGDVSSQVALANRIISTIITETKENELDEMTVAERAEQLLALFDKKISILSLDEKAAIIRPETSMRKARYLLVQSTSRRCLPSSRRKLYPVTVLICWYPSLNGADCA